MTGAWVSAWGTYGAGAGVRTPVSVVVTAMSLTVLCKLTGPNYRWLILCGGGGGAGEMALFGGGGF